MHSMVYIILIAVGVCLAHYRRYEDTHNLIARDEPQSDVNSVIDLVACPVCTMSWLPYREECNIVHGNKRYKQCKWGTYVNHRCGNRLDCFRGPGEDCTEKNIDDIYGQRCAYGYYCNPIMKQCQGIDFSFDSNNLWRGVSPELRYPLKATETFSIKE